MPLNYSQVLHCCEPVHRATPLFGALAEHRIVRRAQGRNGARAADRAHEHDHAGLPPHELFTVCGILRAPLW